MIFSGHSFGSGVWTMSTVMVANHVNRLGKVPKSLLMCYAVAPTRCLSLNLAVKYADVIYSVVLQLVLLRSMDGADLEWAKKAKGNVYYMVVEGFQLLSRWTGCVWEQCAWKFSRPCKDPISSDSHEIALSYSDYEKVVQYNDSDEEIKVMVELVSYIKGIGLLLQMADILVADALWDTIHVEVQDFV